MHASASENLPYKKRKENRQSQEVSFANFINLFRFSFDNIPSHFLNLLSSLGSFLPIDYLCNVIKSAPFTSLQDSGDFRSQTSIIASSDDNLSDCTECMINLLLLNLSPALPPLYGVQLGSLPYGLTCDPHNYRHVEPYLEPGRRQK